MVFLGYAVDGRGTNPLVAIKRPHRHLATDKAFLSMLLDEARLASLIHHDNVVKVRELGFHSGEPFIVMDYIEGASLSDLRKELAAAERAVDTRIALRVVLDALAGLHAAHELRDESGKPLGIIHRDVSPHNVLVGSDGHARLTDFGIAKAEDRLQTTRTHEVKGKLAYLAPERVDRRRMCNKQSDVFSMAVVLWECIAGRRLFRGDEAIDTLHEVMSAPIPRLRQIGAKIPPALDDVIARGLSRDLDIRFQTAADFAAAIERAAGRGNVGRPEDVARVVETIFGERLAARHEQIRASLEDPDFSRSLFEASGIPERQKPAVPSTASNIALLASIAPLAPSERYTFGKGPAEDYERVQAKKTRVGVLSGIAGGVAIGALVTLVVASRPASVPPTPGAAPSAPVAQASASAAVPAALARVRRVVVSLPFVAAHVRFDDMERELAPASDVVAFDVPTESGARHRVTATALEGSRADGYVREVDGLAHVEPEGFAMSIDAGDIIPGYVGPHARPASLGTGRPPPETATRNGFTRLR